MHAVPIYKDFADEILKERDLEGIRGMPQEESRYELHVATASFAQMPIDQIRSTHIREWHRAMAVKVAADGRGERTLSHATIARASSLASAIFVAAVDRELIPMSPFTGVRLKKRATEADTKEKWAYWTPDEQRSLWDCSDIPRPDRLFLLFAIYTGMRQGELYHLELPDLHVDGPKPSVYVRYGSIRKGKKLPPKSGKRREVPLLPHAIPIAREWLAQLHDFAPVNEHGLVFPSRKGLVRLTGKPFGGAGGLLHQYCERAGVKRARFHDARHTCASSLIAGWWGRKWTIEEVKAFLGHSNSNTTQRYAHLAGSVIEEAARETIHAHPLMPIVMPAAPDTDQDLGYETERDVSAWLGEEVA